jgi:hypothetical protein
VSDFINISKKVFTLSNFTHFNAFDGIGFLHKSFTAFNRSLLGCRFLRAHQINMHTSSMLISYKHFHIQYYYMLINLNINMEFYKIAHVAAGTYKEEQM